MNTDLHVLEAYTQLYRIAASELLNKRLRQLILNFSDHFIDEGSGHLRLFFDENWKVKPGPISYGHDIEASWLLLEAAEVLGDKLLVEVIKEIALNLLKQP